MMQAPEIAGAALQSNFCAAEVLLKRKKRSFGKLIIEREILPATAKTT